MISSINDTPPYKNKSFLHQKYVSEGLSPQQIASEIFSARITISKHLKKFEIPIREKDICQKSGRALGYGEMRRNGVIQSRKGEIEVIKKMLMLRDKDFSYGKIAKFLNLLRIVCKQDRIY